MTDRFQLLRDYCGQPCEGWLMSEKLDGWRVMWDGQNFITRQGNVLNAPSWFTAGLPDHALDGELFAGRRNFNAIQGMIANDWRGLTFQIFDAPMMDAPFRKRYAFINSLVLPDHCGIVKQIRCNGTEHALDIADQIVDQGGEGVVVRNPRAKYEIGRTWNVLRWVPQAPAKNRI